MQTLSYHTFTHLPRFLVRGNITHSSSTRSPFFHDSGFGINKFTMARRNFIKAYNDMVGSSGQSNVRGINISEMSNNGIGANPRDVNSFSRQTPLKLPNKEESYPSRYVVNPKMKYRAPSPPETVQAIKWDNMKRKDRNLFIDIDGENFPTEELNDEAVKVVDTSHKVQRHISLVDLSRPYIARSVYSGNVLRENLGKELVDAAQSVGPKTLPKGFNTTDQPYVLPKFTPTLREMISAKGKPKDTLVSITESTPPSMQKWAIEWNSEPKHSISISELKEDLIREKYERTKRGSGSPKDLIFADEEATSSKDIEQQELVEHIPQNKTERTKTNEPTAQSTLRRSQHSLKPEDSDNYTFYNHRDSIDTLIDPKQYEQKMKQTDSKVPLIKVGLQSSIDWLPEKYNEMKKRFNEKHIEKYSFSAVFREKENDGQQNLSHPIKASLLEGNIDHMHTFDEDRRKFHEWFRSRLLRAGRLEDDNRTKNGFADVKDGGMNAYYDVRGSDPYSVSDKKIGLKSVTYSEGDPTRVHTKENLSSRKLVKTGNDKSGKLLTDIPDFLPPNEELKEKPLAGLAERYSSEKNSSFYFWLKQRGLMNVIKSKRSLRAPSSPVPPGQPDEVAKPGLKFPWSKTYLCKYTPRTSSNAKENIESKPGSRWVTSESSRDTIPLRKAVTQINLKKKEITTKKVKSQGNIPRSGAKKPGTKQGKSRAKKNIHPIKNTHKREEQKAEQSERIPYYGWVVGNEVDYIKNLRFLENQHASPIVENRKKLFPTLLEQMPTPVTSSLNYWESKYIEPLSPSKIRKGGGAFVDNSKKRKKTERNRSLTSLENLLDDKNFINISDDSIPLKTVFVDSDGIAKLKSSRSVDDDIRISQYAVKTSQQIGKKLSIGNPTLIANPPGTSNTTEDSLIHLQLAQNASTKPGEGKIQDSSQTDQDERFPVSNLETDRNEVDEDWIDMIGPKGFNLNNDGDLIHRLKRPQL